MSKLKSNRKGNRLTIEGLTYAAAELFVEQDEKIESMDKTINWMFNALIVFAVLNLVSLGCLVMLIFK